jgi:CelD/BcsL family acetyltransferase involved in cellulose biosynthesis
VYGNSYYLPSLGYDNDYSKYSPGKVLLAMSWEELIKHSDTQLFDYGFGAGDYKEKYSDNCIREGAFFIFRTGLKGWIIYLIINSLNKTNKIIKRVFTRIGWYTKLKTTWRRKKAQKLQR